MGDDRMLMGHNFNKDIGTEGEFLYENTVTHKLLNDTTIHLLGNSYFGSTASKQ